MPLASGALVGPYEILTLIGKGGMGEVYRAADRRLSREVAIKLLLPGYAADPERLRRFDREARAAAALNHPNILAIYDIGTADGAPYIVSELLQGRTLRAVLGRGPLVSRTAVEFAIAIATGVAAAHDAGIVHRDLKPENVFITTGGLIKILDFGLAKLREAPAGEGETNTAAADTDSPIVGTAGYMSPEQVRSEPVDYRSDIFSFGAVLYEMVSGQRAFVGSSAIETLSAILKHDPPLLNAVDGGVSPPLVSVIRHCLEKERERRFQSAHDLIFVLNRLAETPDSSSVALLSTRHRRRRRHRPLPRWIGAAVAGLAAVLATVAAAYWLPAPVTLPPHFEQLTFRRGTISAARFAPDGHTVISSANFDGRAVELLSTRLDSEEPVALPPTGALLRSISGTGELAVLVKNHVLARVPIGGGGVRELTDSVVDADWSSDGSLAAVRWQASVHAWVEFPIGNVIYDQTHAINAIRVAPNGELLAVMEQERFGGGVGWLRIIDRRGAVVATSERWATVFRDSLAWTPDGREVWFTASEEEGRSAIHGMARDGHERIVHRGIGSVSILDFASDGRALVVQDWFRADMSLVDINAAEERNLTWRNWSRPMALSDDGQMLAFGAGGRTNRQGRIPGFIRRTDGAPAVLLSEEGNPMAFSPDGQWVVTTSPSSDGWTLVPTSIGNARRVALADVRSNGMTNGVRWLDGKRIVFVGNEKDRPRRLFVQDIDGGPPAPLTPEDAAGPFVVSPDASVVVVRDPAGALSRYPIIGGSATALAGALVGDQPLAWSPDGRSIWVLNRSTTPATIFRIDLGSGQRSYWRDVPYPDPASIEPGSLRVVMSADGSKFVYGYQTHLSELYLATGLR